MGDASPPLLALEGLRRAYGPVLALDGVDLDLVAGEIHALVGENGAGKSTLVKIVAGLLSPDAGSVRLDGEPVVLSSRAASAAAGIGVVHQHFSLVDTLTAAENLQLGRPGAGRRLRLDVARRELADWADRTRIPVPPDLPVGELSVGVRQRVEILTALVWGARLLLLDEPTAVLSPLEADSVLEVVRQLTREGLGVILVTHKLREVGAVADRVTVLRAGRVVGHHDGRAVSREELVHEMLGEGRHPEPVAAIPRHGEVRLRVSELETRQLHRLSFDVRAGEIVGVAGVAGNGQTDLVAALVGRERPTNGEVRIGEVRMGGEEAAALAAGVAYIPEDRAADGLAVGLPVWTNAVAKSTADIGDWRRVDRRRVEAITDRVLGFLGVRPAAPALPVHHLSGGNQQRLVIGRELHRQPAVVVAAEPTRGLDPASAADVLDALRRAAAGGAAVVLVSSDLDELLTMAERLLVLFEGQIVLDVARDDAERAAVGRAMVGV
jgi:simple sugar transport system ATP-binding protein